jgi:hypothetical protein
VPRGEETEYFIAPTCYYPEGRHVPLGPWGREEQPVPLESTADRAEAEWGFLLDGIASSGERSGNP